MKLIFFANRILTTLVLEKNNKYNISLPHDNKDTVDGCINKYKRRVKRLKEHFENEPYVLLIYTARKESIDDKLLQTFNDISKLRDHVYLYSINGFSKPINNNKVFNFNIVYKYTFDDEWNTRKTYYDQIIYRQNIYNHFKNNIEDVLTCIKLGIQLKNISQLANK